VGRHQRGYRFQQARKALLADGPICVHCRRRPASVADHQPPLAVHDHVEGSGCCVLVPSCQACSLVQGGKLGRHVQTRALPSRPVTRSLEGEPDGFGVDDAVWDVAPWLDGLREVPGDAVWPRFMTVPHPDAVGTVGDDLVAHAAANGVRFRWWQRLVSARVLEVDAQGQLVWLRVLLSMARQCGKSTFVRALCEWRLEQADRFGEPQTVLHTADKVASAKEVQARSWARAERLGYGVRRAQGELEISLPDGSRWLVRSQRAVYGYTVSLGVADECHDIAVVAVVEGLEPTLVESAQGQLILTSTAHSQATPLFPVRRRDGLAELDAPGSTLLVEWSAPRGLAVMDEVSWRLASPHWHRRRAVEVADAARAAAAVEHAGPTVHELVAGFDCQWRNVWPLDAVVRGKGEPLLDPEVWASLAEPVVSSGRCWIGLEDNLGHGAAVAAACLLDDGRVEVDGWECPSWDMACDDVRKVADDRPGSVLLVGASMHGSLPRDLGVARVVKVGLSETKTGLPLLRSMVAERRVVHDVSTAELDAQLTVARVTPAATGLSLVPGQRHDLVHAAVWVLQAAEHQSPIPDIA
jgi:hypothetical protein